MSEAAVEFAIPTELDQTARYCFPLSAVVTVKLSVAIVAPLRLVKLTPSVLTCHCTVGDGEPVAAELKVAVEPAQFTLANGFCVTAGACVVGGGGGGGGAIVNCNGADDVAGEVLLLLDASFDVTRK